MYNHRLVYMALNGPVPTAARAADLSDIYRT